MPTKIEGKSIFGSEKRAEMILYSSKTSIPGKKFVSSTQYGLNLEMLARGDRPRVFIYFGAGKLKKLAEGIPSNLQLSFSEHGLDFLIQSGTIEIHAHSIMPSTPKLFAGEIKNIIEQELLGMIEITPEGNFFYTKEECQNIREETGALAVFDGAKKRELSDKSKAYLARDAVLNALLKK